MWPAGISIGEWLAESGLFGSFGPGDFHQKVTCLAHLDRGISIGKWLVWLIW